MNFRKHEAPGYEILRNIHKFEFWLVLFWKYCWRKRRLRGILNLQKLHSGKWNLNICAYSLGTFNIWQNPVENYWKLHFVWNESIERRITVKGLFTKVCYKKTTCLINLSWKKYTSFALLATFSISLWNKSSSRFELFLSSCLYVKSY